MVNEINSNTAVLANSVSFPATSSARKGADPVQGPAGPGQKSELLRSSAQDAPNESLAPTQQGKDSTANLDRVQQIALASRTSAHYAQDPEDGKMYLYVKDRRTGEDLYRIPRKYITAEPEVESATRVDLRI